MNTASETNGLVMKVSYPDTLKAIEVGKPKSFLMIGRLYNGMMMAIRRLNESGLYEFEYKIDESTNQLIVTRNK